jgi:hypothetical protein
MTQQQPYKKKLIEVSKTFTIPVFPGIEVKTRGVAMDIF